MSLHHALQLSFILRLSANPMPARARREAHPAGPHSNARQGLFLKSPSHSYFFFLFLILIYSIAGKYHANLRDICAAIFRFI